LQGDNAFGTRDLAFHARLMELALQAGNAGGPQMHEDRKRGRAVNAQEPEARRLETRTVPNRECVVTFEDGRRKMHAKTRRRPCDCGL
jgi:hypothetical protein